MIEIPQVEPFGDSAFLIQFDQANLEDANSDAIRLHTWLNGHRINGILESIPGFASLLITYDAFILGADEVEGWIKNLALSCPDQKHDLGRLVEVPVIYGGSAGPDLLSVANLHNLTPEEVIQLHCQGEYRVAMMGFTPGFVYLSGLDPKLTTPRLPTPRTSVPAGSVGIAGTQTGIYSIDSPGGWQLIGRTKIKLFEPSLESPFYFRLGDRIKFIATESTLSI